MSSLQDKFISETYTGLLHSDGALLGSGTTLIYDGTGNTSALSLGRSGNGATVSGQLSTSDLTVGQLSYPKTAGSINSIVVQNSSSGLGLVAQLPNSYLADITVSSTDDKYSAIDYIKVNDKGRISEVSEISNTGNDLKLISKLQFNSSPAITVTTVDVGNDWQKVDISSINDNSHSPQMINAKTVIVSLSPVDGNDDTTYGPDLGNNTVNLRASRYPYTTTGDDYLTDSGGNRVIKIKGGYIPTIQAQICISDGNGKASGNSPAFYLKDTGSYAASINGKKLKWEVRVEAWGY